MNIKVTKDRILIKRTIQPKTVLNLVGVDRSNAELFTVMDEIVIAGSEVEIESNYPIFSKHCTPDAVTSTTMEGEIETDYLIIDSRYVVGYHIDKPDAWTLKKS
jgi:hypothetical protein